MRHLQFVAKLYSIETTQVPGGAMIRADIEEAYSASHQQEKKK